MTTAVEIPRDRWLRPLIVPPGGGEPTAYVRVSTLAKALDDLNNLMLWKQRKTAQGLLMRPDLMTRLSGAACHCNLGLSAKAIAYAGHVDHPHDPGDLRRCIDYCRTSGISVPRLRERMAGRSPEWDALLPHWNELAGMLADEIETRTDGCAPLTYARMKELLRGATC